ncbi:hypothetical protein PS903_02474 [Pseudomonas fluorescens]|nr:hypothetical protein PS903_02474 [Pseudomonas fluorescens]
MNEHVDLKGESKATGVMLRPKSKEYLDELKEVMEGSAQALQAGYKYLFLGEVYQLLTAYDYSLSDVRRMLSGESATLKAQSKTSATSTDSVRDHIKTVRASLTNTNTNTNTKPRAERTYLNPHTDESITLRSSKNKTLKLWQEKYGAETVNRWQIK